MAYGVKASDYLGRATALLHSEDDTALFYAAFELRCGIEARLKEYFDAQAETTKKRRAGWQIDRLAKQVESVFELGSSKGYRLIVFDAETSDPISTVMYTPVTPQLQKMAERLGDYLHSQSSERASDPSFWNQFRNRLRLVREELAFACSGKLLAPPLVHPINQGQRFFCVEGDQRDIFPAGKRIGWRYEIYEIEPLDEFAL